VEILQALLEEIWEDFSRIAEWTNDVHATIKAIGETAFSELVADSKNNKQPESSQESGNLTAGGRY